PPAGTAPVAVPHQDLRAQPAGHARRTGGHRVGQVDRGQRLQARRRATADRIQRADYAARLGADTGVGEELGQVELFGVFVYGGPPGGGELVERGADGLACGVGGVLRPPAGQERQHARRVELAVGEQQQIEPLRVSGQGYERRVCPDRGGETRFLAR